MIVHQGHTGVDRWQPRFLVLLRADDLAVLETLQRRFGGTLAFRPAVEGNPSRPRWQWTVSSGVDMAALVAYFDRFPLRAKKQRDYAVWRRAIGVYLEQGGRAPELAQLREALMAGRAYDASHEDTPVVAHEPQLQLMTGGLSH